MKITREPPQEPKQGACIHYPHELKDSLHEVLKIDFKRGSQLAIIRGVVDYCQSAPDIALKIAQKVNTYMPKTQSALVRSVKAIARDTKELTPAQLEEQNEIIKAQLKVSNPALFKVMFPEPKKDKKQS